MTLVTSRNYILLFIAIFFIECNSLEKNDTKTAHKQVPKYELIKDWPQLPKTFPFSKVSAVGIDTSQNVFMLQRSGREWLDSLPDSLISSNTIFLLDKETGKVLNSWGANLFIMPHGLTVDEENNVWVTDVGLNQVFKFNHNDGLLLKLGVAKIAGNDSVHFNLPTDIAIAHDGSFYVSDGYGNSRIIKFSKEGKYLFEWGKKGTGHSEFNIPHGIGLDSHGKVFVADRENNRIQEFDMNGNFINEWKNDQAKQLGSLSIDKADNVFAVDDIYEKNSFGDDIIQLDSGLNLITRFGRSDSSVDTSALFHDIAVDKEGSIYVANFLGKKVQKFKLVFTK
jgi:peptidylamidoglycolate lyase